MTTNQRFTTPSKFAIALTAHATAVLLGVFFLGLILIYAQIRFDPEHGSIPLLVVGHLGIALVISGILGLTIEQFTKVRHEAHRDELVSALDEHRRITIEDLQRHVLRAVYRRSLPDELIDTVEAEVFQTHFLRRNWEALYEIRRVEGVQGRISLRTVLSYQIENVSKIEKELKIPTTIDMSSSHYSAELCGLKGVEIDGHQLDRDEIKALMSSDQSTATCKFEIVRSLKAGESVNVKIDYVQLNPDEATEFLSTRYPGTEMTVTAIVPAEDFDVTLVSLHQNEPHALHQGPTHWRWTLGPALYPGQGTALIWRPRDKVAETEPSLNGV